MEFDYGLRNIEHLGFDRYYMNTQTIHTYTTLTRERERELVRNMHTNVHIANRTQMRSSESSRLTFLCNIQNRA